MYKVRNVTIEFGIFIEDFPFWISFRVLVSLLFSLFYIDKSEYKGELWKISSLRYIFTKRKTNCLLI